MSERTPEWLAQRDQLRERWMCGNRGAISFLAALGEFVELWDDIVDQDKPVTAERVHNALAGFLLDGAMNPWAAEHRDLLTPVLLLMVSAYLDSEELCRDQDIKNRQVAFHLRNYPLELYHICAAICGGWDHLRSVAPEMRRFFATERYEDWEYG